MQYYDLTNLLITADTIEELEAHRTEILDTIPELEKTVGFDQKHEAHPYDLWTHLLHTVLNLPKNLDDVVYLAALLHDIGKPETQTRGKRPGDKNMHYYGHAEKSAEIVRDIVLPDLHAHNIRVPYEDQSRLLYFVAHHADHISMRVKTVRKHIPLAYMSDFKQLMHLQIADAKAHTHTPVIQDRIDRCQKMLDGHADYLYQKILSERTV